MNSVSPVDKITFDRGVQAFIPQIVTPEIIKCKKTSECLKCNCYCELQISNISYKISSCFAGFMRNSVWTLLSLLSFSTEKLSSKSLRNIFKALDSMEVEWTLGQRESLKERVDKSMEKSKRPNELVNCYLRNTRSMVDPFSKRIFFFLFFLFLKSTHKEDKK